MSIRLTVDFAPFASTACRVFMSIRMSREFAFARRLRKFQRHQSAGAVDETKGPAGLA